MNFDTMLRPRGSGADLYSDGWGARLGSSGGGYGWGHTSHHMMHHRPHYHDHHDTEQGLLQQHYRDVTSPLLPKRPAF